MARKVKRKERLTPQSMSGISVDEALAGAMQVPPPADKPKKKRRAKKKAKRKKKAAP